MLRKRKSPRRWSSLLEHLELRCLLTGNASILPASVISGTSTTGNGSAEAGSVSADGLYTVFVSDSTNLVSGQNDATATRDVFLYNNETQAVTLVSHAFGASNTAANGESFLPAISADGRFVAYVSLATDLVDGQSDANFDADVFLFDRVNGTTSLISHSAGAPTTAGNTRSGGNGASQPGDGRPAISDNGQYIAFLSGASDLISGMDGGGFNVYHYNAVNDHMLLASRSADSATAGGDSTSLNPVISGDGRYVAFTSGAENLVTGQVDNNRVLGGWDVFLFDSVATVDTTLLVSGAGGSETETGNASTFSDLELAISGDGRYLAFKSFAENLVPGITDDNHNSDIFLFDRTASPGSNIALVSHANGNLNAAATGDSGSSETPVISNDGRFVAYKSTATNIAAQDNNHAYDIFVFDNDFGTNTLVSHASGSLASSNNHSALPVISRDGSTIAYSSLATNLVSGQSDTNLLADVIVYDVALGLNVLVSGAGSSSTIAGDGTSAVIALSSDGLTVVFNSLATNLAGTDANGLQDVFVSAKSSPKFAFRADTFTVDENGTTARIRVDRTGDTSVSAAVDYRAYGNGDLLSATAGSDFDAVEETLVFAPGETSLTFDVTIRDDSTLEENERIYLQLLDPSPGSSLGSPSEALLMIRDNDGLGLITINSDGSGTGNASIGHTLISDDGRFVAFTSGSTNLVAGFVDGNAPEAESDAANISDIFVRDRLTETTRLISRNVSGTASGNGGSLLEDISADGRFILYSSRATDLVAGVTDANGHAVDFFLFDQLTNQTLLVSSSRVANTTGNVVPEFGYDGQISDDGRYVFFKTNANDIVEDGVDTNESMDLYRYDLLEQQTILVSQALDGTASNAGLTYTHFTISTNGRFVVYPTTTSVTDVVTGIDSDPPRFHHDLIDGDTFRPEEQVDLIWRDLDTGATKLVSVNQAGNSTFDDTPGGTYPVTDDGRLVAFYAGAEDVVQGLVNPLHYDNAFIRDMYAGITTIIRGDSSLAGSHSSSISDLTPDGQYLLFDTTLPDMVDGITDTNNYYDVFLYDIQQQQMIPISLDPTNQAMGNEGGLAQGSSISRNGRFVTFTSNSTNLVDGLIDTNQPAFVNKDVFLRDVWTQTTTALSVHGNVTGNSQSENPSITPSGSFVIFTSRATDLAPGIVDLNDFLFYGEQKSDIFISPGAFLPGSFQFSVTNVSVAEGATEADITVERLGGSNGTFAMIFRTTAGSATANTDYLTRFDSVLFADGQTTATIHVPIVDDGLDEGNETFTVTLTDPSGYDLLGNNTVATVTIVDEDTTVTGTQIIESDGDVVSVTLKGSGSVALSLDDPDGNGKGPIQIILTGTNTSSTLTIAVTAHGGDGFANIGSITGTGGLKTLAGAKANLTGTGIDLGGSVLTFALHDVLNGADITLGGSPSQFIKMTFNRVQDDTTITLRSGVKTLTAASMGHSNIFGTSIQTLSIKGNMSSNVFLSGQGIAAGKNTLNKATIAGSILDAIFSVYSGAGGIGTITAEAMTRSGISAGYTPADFTHPMSGGTFAPALVIKSIKINGLFSNSLIAAKVVTAVALESIDTSTPEGAADYGILADTSIGKVTVKSPAFSRSATGGADQSINRFHVKIV